MSRNSWIVLVVTLLSVVAFWLGNPAAAQVAVARAAPAPAAPQAAPEAAPAQIVATGVYVWNYSVKFVCGEQTAEAATGAPIIGEPPVKPGNYATEINIHNYNYRDVKVLKKLLVMVKDGNVVAREPESAQPGKFVSVPLGPDFATMDDCIALWRMANVSPTVPNPPIWIGYLVILSPVDLDVDAVYTAAVYNKVVGTNTAQAAGISIDVERVAGKRVFVPANFANQFP